MTLCAFFISSAFIVVTATDGRSPSTLLAVGCAMRESQIEDYLVERVKAKGGEVRKLKWIGRRGAPDRLVLLPPTPLGHGVRIPGAVLWVELKAPGEKPKPHQQREHDRMRRMGQSVVVVDSLERVDEVVR